MNHPLQPREIVLPFAYQYRVLYLDPSDIYTRIHISATARHQSSKLMGLPVMFPKPLTKICSCGCGKPLPPKRSRWASDDCARFAIDIYNIIYGQLDTIKYYLKKYQGYKCKCGRVRKMKVDHIIPVKLGGGGCWLSNYQFLCHNCHVEKTKIDFGWRGKRVTS